MSPLFGATQDAVVRTLQRQRCKIDEAVASAASLYFRLGETKFAIPKAPNGFMYTADQLMRIEKTLAFLELELYPIDGN